MATGVIDARSPEEATVTVPREPRERPRWLRLVRLSAAVVAVVAVATSPWWGPRALSRLDYFHVRRVEFFGVRYAKTSELLALLHVDTLQSVWQPLEPLAQRLQAHPLVRTVEVDRELPGRLSVHVVEREPAALVPGDGRLQPADAAGHLLPIDPVRVPLDLPLAAQSDSALLAVLDALRQSAPELYGRIVQAERVGKEELRFRLGTLIVRTTPDVTVARFKDILPVEADLTRNALRVVELDLRFRDQVIARQP
ncbi:MAG: FtsQ-type POTRA domain-containing protein [Gemmatimonadaceae bacterium]|nr:FtsQ-type POTRA domain-containing protein [Gemmatimonadaceae bacterium]